MKKIYLDNAATTPIRQEVIDEMIIVMQNDYGNPSSTHSYGRSAKTVLETSRKSIAKLLGLCLDISPSTVACIFCKRSYASLLDDILRTSIINIFGLLVVASIIA